MASWESLVFKMHTKYVHMKPLLLAALVVCSICSLLVLRLGGYPVSYLAHGYDVHLDVHALLNECARSIARAYCKQWLFSKTLTIKLLGISDEQCVSILEPALM